jgi:DNA-binding GntR family transcriptional regulator
MAPAMVNAAGAIYVCTMRYTIGSFWDPKRIPMATVKEGAADSAHERSYRSLLDMIISREIGPGEVLEERRLSVQLGVSRTPLRAAFNRLLGEGIVARLSNGSIIVKAYGSTEMLELLQLRILLESEAAALAANRIPAGKLTELRDALSAILDQPEVTEQQDWSVDNRLHELIADHCGNRIMATVISDARLRLRLCNVERLEGRPLQARREHMDIVQALERADADAAREAMNTHLSNVRRAYLGSLGYLT